MLVIASQSENHLSKVVNGGTAVALYTDIEEKFGNYYHQIDKQNQDCHQHDDW